MKLTLVGGSNPAAKRARRPQRLASTLKSVPVLKYLLSHQPESFTKNSLAVSLEVQP